MCRVFVLITISMIAVMSCIMTGCTLKRPELNLEDTVIDDVAVWEGDIWIDGVVTVKKSGVLEIKPGTRVRFVPRDRDGDGIGDGELLVEGTLIAVGTPDAPIVFTSAAETQKPADWKYLYLDFAGPSEIRHIVSEYAYSGLQIHFSRARVTHSVFRYNIDGLRFSTVNLLAAGNQMHDNRHGLRYEERNSKAHIHHNDIRNNDIGIFVVTRSVGKALIERNNIVENKQYNVKFGWQQPEDISFPNNWWGTTDQEVIEATFLDSTMDNTLGRVNAPNPLIVPVRLNDWEE